MYKPLPILIAAVLCSAPASPAAGSIGAGIDPSPSITPQPLPVPDLHRIWYNRAYAEEVVRNLEAIDSQAVDQGMLPHLFGLRAVALAGADRPGDSGAWVDRMLGLRSPVVRHYRLVWIASWRNSDVERLVAIVERAGESVPQADRQQLFEAFGPETLLPLFRQVDDEIHRARRTRLIEALGNLGWPGDSDPEARDQMRRILVDSRLEASDRTAAARIANTIASPSELIALLSMRKYDGLLGEVADPTERLRAAAAAQDRITAAAVAVDPGNHRLVLRRARFLRSVGRSAEAVELARPFMSDVAAVFAASEEGMWLIHEAAYALLDLGRRDEAVELMERLVSQPMAERRGLIDPSINYIALLSEAGQPAVAQAHARALQHQAPGLVNAYGQRWIDEGVVCALAAMGRSGEAAPEIARLLERSDDNPSAATRALLCLGDDGAAAELMVRRLEGSDPESAILALQRYEVADPDDRSNPLYERLDALRDRPRVAEALARVGRSLRLPFSRKFYGQF